jgi:MOSC domain-containing protein YiiM
MGTIERIYIAPGKRRKVKRIESAELEAGSGIVGDRYHALALQYVERDMPVPANHISFVEQEKLDEFIGRHALQVDYGDFRRSVITRGIDLNALVGQHFRVGEAVCYGVELCEPCSQLARIVHKAVLTEMRLTAGLRAIILESGSVWPGDAINTIDESLADLSPVNNPLNGQEIISNSSSSS